MSKLIYWSFCILSVGFLGGSTLKSPDYIFQERDQFLSNPRLYQAINFKSVDYALLTAAIFHLTNDFRQKSGLPAFSYSKEAGQAAFGHAEDMVKHSFYGHVSPIRFRRTLRDRLNRSGINPPYIGENICSTFGIQYEEGKKVKKPIQAGEFRYLSAKQELIPPHSYFSLAQSMVNLWINSPGHRQNLLNPAFTHMGCGAYVYFDRNFYQMPYFMGVQNFIGRDSKKP